jgi:hypothetical protein
MVEKCILGKGVQLPEVGALLPVRLNRYQLRSTARRVAMWHSAKRLHFPLSARNMGRIQVIKSPKQSELSQIFSFNVDIMKKSKRECPESPNASAGNRTRGPSTLFRMNSNGNDGFYH